MEIQLTQIIFQIINFGVVAFVLAKFLYQPILKILDQRSEKIEAGLKAADENLKKQSEIEKQVEAELKKARKEANQILSEAKRDAEKKSAAMLKDAREEAKKALEKERQAFEASLEREKKEFRQQAAELVRDLTRSVLSNALSETEQKKIIDTQITKVLKGANLG